MSMKFLIVSDTHGRMYNLEEAMEREEFDGMIHCGDVEGMDDLIKSKVNGPCYMVMGNNDWFSNLPAEIQVNIDDYRAFITHGHNYGVSLGLEGIYAEALSRGVDIPGTAPSLSRSHPSSAPFHSGIPLHSNPEFPFVNSPCYNFIKPRNKESAYSRERGFFG